MCSAASSRTPSRTSPASGCSGTRTRSRAGAASRSTSSRSASRRSTARSTSPARACARAATRATAISRPRTCRWTGFRRRSKRSATTRRPRAGCSCRSRRGVAPRWKRSSLRRGCSSAASVASRRAPESSSSDVTRLGMIHGRFQPFHNGHLEYLRGAAMQSAVVFIGITNPDPARIKEEPSDPLRHLPESNPYTYVERLLMVKAAAADAGIPAERLHVIPFPVNEPELWPPYVPPDVVQFIRLFSDWGGTKLDRLHAAGYEVVVLDEGAEKEVSGAEVREALRRDGDWGTLVPPGVAALLRQFEGAGVRAV